MSRSLTLTGAVSALAVLLLSGCAEDGVADVRQWMDETKRQTPVKIAKIAEPKTFIPFAYGGADSVDPYDPAKLASALAKLQASTSTGIKPDLERPREPLEQYPLDTLTMVGTLQKVGLSYALLQSDRNVFQVKVGNYIGQNFGLVTSISESEVDLKEIVQDASGEWVERPAKLELQETKK
jgi:type IV pilus assembly protein PilP